LPSSKTRTATISRCSNRAEWTPADRVSWPEVEVRSQPCEIVSQVKRELQSLGATIEWTARVAESIRARG
jgi:hypothetical protein